MNTMNMPGFTADISLYRTCGRYRSVANQSHISGGEGVVAQIRVGGGFGTTGGLGFLDLPSWCETKCYIGYTLCLAAWGATIAGAAACSYFAWACVDDCNSNDIF